MELQAVLADLGAFAGLLACMQSVDNAVRIKGESLYGEVCTKRADAVVSNLVKLARTDPNPELRHTCVVLLRKVRMQAGFRYINLIQTAQDIRVSGALEGAFLFKLFES